MRRSENTMSRFLEILFTGLANIAEFLGISVEKRKPRALHLDHDAVAFQECVHDVRKLKFHLCHLTRDKGLWFFKAVAEFPPNNISSDEPLVAAHPHVLGIVPRIRSIAGKDVDDFHHPVCIGSGRGDIELGCDGTCNLDVF